MEDRTHALTPQFPVEYYGGRYKERLIDDLTGRGNVYALIRTLHNQASDFPETYSNYLSALNRIEELLGPGSNHTVKKLAVAIDMQCGSNLYWSGIEGLKMNYQHFKDPFTPNCTWKNIDFDDYLRIGISSSMPIYEAAEHFIEQVRKSLPEGNDEVWEPITSYEVALELYGMKLAHYYGYLAGNDLLRHYIPAYQSDPALDFSYKRVLEDYFNRPLRMDEWEGAYRVSDWIVAPIELSDPQTDMVLREQICRYK